MSWPISGELGAALVAGNQRIAIEADILRNDVPILTNLPVSDGSVTVSSTSANQRTATLTVGPLPEFMSDGFLTMIAPYGDEIRLRRGLWLPDGTAETVPLGVFQISASSVKHTAGLAYSIDTTYDRARRVSRTGFSDYVTIAAGTNAADAILQLVSPALSPRQQYAFLLTNYVVPLMVYGPGDDRWAKASAIAAAIGGLLYFDPSGVLILQPVPDATAASVWTFSPGPQAVVTSIASSLKDDDLANHIVVVGQGSGSAAPVLAEAINDDPVSPTNIDAVGEIIYTISDSTILTTDQAQTVANAELVKRKNVTQQVDVETLVLPQLDAWDVISVVDPDIQVSGRYVIDQLTVPLGGGTMSITTRGQAA